MATGSADGSIVFWDLKRHASSTVTEQINCRVKSLSDFTHWVVKIILCSSQQHQVSAFKDCNIIFSMTRDNITLHSWHKESSRQTTEIEEVSEKDKKE